MIGYWLLQALGNALPGREVACLVCRTLVAADDPAFSSPAKFVGPVYGAAEACRLAAKRSWQIRHDGTAWRRVVPSREPRELLDLPVIRRLVDDRVIIICAGAGASRSSEPRAVAATTSRRSWTRTWWPRCWRSGWTPMRFSSSPPSQRSSTTTGRPPLGHPSRPCRRTPPRAVRCRLDGPEGRGRLPLRGVHRPDRRYRSARGRRRPPRWKPRHDRPELTIGRYARAARPARRPPVG